MNHREFEDAKPYETHAIMVWHAGGFVIHEDGFRNRTAAELAAGRVLDGWPVSERPENVRYPVIVVKISQV